MIFNPYNLSSTSAEVLSQQVAEQLSWAPKLLQDNTLIITLILGFIIIDILACFRKGVLQHQVAWLIDTRNSRTFESQMIVFPWIKPLLIIQTFLFSGISLFCVFDDEAALHLSSTGFVSSRSFWMYLLALPLWVAAQQLSFNWFCYLFSLKNKQTIMNRTYNASYMVLAPITMIVFVTMMTGLVETSTTLVLLTSLFILSQIAFIFNCFKIFSNGIASVLIIFAYLCTLEIAPILVLWAKITS